MYNILIRLGDLNRRIQLESFLVFAILTVIEDLRPGQFEMIRYQKSLLPPITPSYL